LLSDAVTGRMGLFGNAIIGVFEQFLGADYVADLLEATVRPQRLLR
jgi:hypothetical protein